LLAMSLGFLWRDRKEQKRLEEEAAANGDSSERTPLLVTEDVS
jgi:hypothetical protein